MSTRPRLRTLLFACTAIVGGCSGRSNGNGTDNDGGKAQDENAVPESSYLVVDTAQTKCFDNTSALRCPAPGFPFSGQDAQHEGHQPQYRDNGDGTVTDRVTGLMWQRDPGAKQDYAAAIAGAAEFALGGHSDWRVPTIKELYSLYLGSGLDVAPEAQSASTPFIDTDYFGFQYGDTSAGERIIDSQWVTSSLYTSTVLGGRPCFFGVNFADGRIKCYPTSNKTYFAIHVRVNADYGKNAFRDRGDGTIEDRATGLVWQKADNGEALSWEQALAYCEGLSLGGSDTWRLPDVKELQSIVDYSRSPDHTGSAAIDPVFETSGINNEAGQADFPWYWSSTTHESSSPGREGVAADYVAFGRATGYWMGQWLDVHGAGSQRSDPKTGDPADYPQGRGPQGDAIRIFNFVRCVR